LLRHQEVTQFFGSVFFFRPRTDKNGEVDSDNWDRVPFIRRWIIDPDIREVSRIVVDPTRKLTGVYNLFKGYFAEHLERPLHFAGQDFPDEEAAMAYSAQPIIDHIRLVIANNNDAAVTYIIDWLSNIVQRPAQRTEVAISIFGEQGSGKGIVFDWVRAKILGDTHSFQTANPEHDLFGRFATGLVNKTMVQVDEVKNLHEHADKLKDAITNRTVNFEKKGKDAITVDALANFVFTSNNENALRIPTDDRRFVLFRYVVSIVFVRKLKVTPPCSLFPTDALRVTVATPPTSLVSLHI
jgi:hypothetical protein